MKPQLLALAQARRVAITALGLARARPTVRPTARHLRRVMHQLGLLQVDSVSIVAPAHYQVLFSRLGAYDRALLDDLVYRRREFTEQWAHEACILPVSHWPLLRHRVAPDDRRVKALRQVLRQEASYAERVLASVRERGAISAGEMPEPDGSLARTQGWWGWTMAKTMLEAHFALGTLAVAQRRKAGFARVYDLAERVISPEHLARNPQRHEAQREFVRLAARALGVATARDLVDYYRLPIAEGRQRVHDLVAAGELTPVRVEGWKDEAYLVPGTSVPRAVSASTLLSPFDPLVWFRPRTARLFDFEYRLEIYTPAEKRRWGYYVFPYLLGDRLVGRVDLKADRAHATLRVLAAHREQHAEPDAVAGPLSTELHALAGWLGLERVTVSRRGNLARQLAEAVRSVRR